MSRLRKNSTKLIPKLQDYNFTLWTSNEGSLIIKANYGGALIYLEVDNKYDKTFNNTSDLMKFLKKHNARLTGYDNTNDW